MNPYVPPQAPPTQQKTDGVVDLLVPTNPLAAVACWCGILSLVACVPLGPLLGPLALVTGIISRRRGALTQQSRYGKVTSTVRSWIGIVAGGFGTLLGVVMIVLLLKGRH